MKVERISHSESMETTNPFGQKHWFKKSIDVLVEDPTEIDHANEYAEKFIREKLNACIPPNSIPTYFSSDEQLPVIQNQNR